MNLLGMKAILLALLFGHGWCLSAEDAIKRFFNYFKVDEPKGIPVIKFDEPMDLLSPLVVIPLTLINGTLLGHSELRFIEVIIDLMRLEAELKIKDERLEIGGEYKWPGLFSSSSGEINATILGVDIVTNVTMFINENDTLQLRDAQLMMDNEELFLNMAELGWEHELLMATGSVHVFFSDIVQEAFRQLKPLLIHEANRQLRNYVDNLPQAVKPPPSSGNDAKSSLKFFLQRIMMYLRIEPLKLPNQQSEILGVHFKVTNLVLHGMSVVDDIKSLFVFYHGQEFYLESEMVYPKLLLYYTLGLSSGSFLNFDMFEKIQLNDVKWRIKLIVDPSQKTPPKIKDFHVHVESFGKIRTGRNRGFFNSLRNFFLDVADDIRNQIIGALTGPIKRIIQNELDKIDLEEVGLFLVQRRPN